MDEATIDRLETQGAGAWSVTLDDSKLVFGAESLERLGELARELGCRRVLVVTDPGLRAAGHVDRALEALRRESVEACVNDSVDANPTTRQVEEGRRVAEAFAADGLIGLGGGSAMDCAKGINFLLTNGGRMEDYWGSGKATQPMLPSIGVPTTAGTGSDAQSYALISQEESGVKMACGDRKAKFRTVVLDPAVAATAPRHVVALSGIDAVSHVVESYVSTKSNPISRRLASAAWRRLDGALERVLEPGADEEVWGEMLLGSHLAGAAIEHSMLGAAHACANPLTARFDVAHGAAVGLMLPHVMRFNAEQVGRRYEELCADAGRPAGEALYDRVLQLCGAAGLPRRLQDYPIPHDCLTQLAEDASDEWTASFNPRPVGKKELESLYEAAY